MGSHVQIRGDWLNEIWINKPVLVPASLEVENFFDGDHLPMLFPEDERYVHRTERNAVETAVHPEDLGFADRAQGNREAALQMELSLQWLLVLLHHPDTNVVRDALLFWERKCHRYVRSEETMPYQTLFYDSVVDYLLSDDGQLAEVAARCLWRSYSKSNFSDKLFPILTDPRFIDSNRAFSVLSKLCPPEHQRDFNELREADKAFEKNKPQDKREFFIARGSIVEFIYGERQDRTETGGLYARCYSRICPEGENGLVNLQRIVRFITAEEFEEARSRGWEGPAVNQKITESPKRTACKRCGNPVPASEWVCPNCGRTEWGTIGCCTTLAFGLLVIGGFVCGPGFWRWVCIVLGALLALLIVGETIKSLTTYKKPDSRE